MGKLITKVNRTRVQTILADLQLALTFAAVAETSSRPDTQIRNFANARDALFVIRDRLDEKLTSLRR